MKPACLPTYESDFCKDQSFGSKSKSEACNSKGNTFTFLVIFTTHVLNCVTLKCISISVVILFSLHSDHDTEPLILHHRLWRKSKMAGKTKFSVLMGNFCSPIFMDVKWWCAVSGFDCISCFDFDFQFLSLLQLQLFPNL